MIVEQRTPGAQKSPDIINIVPEIIRKKIENKKNKGEIVSEVERQLTIKSFDEGQKALEEDLQTTVDGLEENATEPEIISLRQSLAEAKNKTGRLKAGAIGFMKGTWRGRFALALGKAGYNISTLPGRIARYPIKHEINAVRKSTKKASKAMDEYDQKHPPAQAA